MTATGASLHDDRQVDFLTPPFPGAVCSGNTTAVILYPDSRKVEFSVRQQKGIREENKEESGRYLSEGVERVRSRFRLILETFVAVIRNDVLAGSTFHSLSLFSLLVLGDDFFAGRYARNDGKHTSRQSTEHYSCNHPEGMRFSTDDER